MVLVMCRFVLLTFRIPEQNCLLLGKWYLSSLQHLQVGPLLFMLWAETTETR